MIRSVLQLLRRLRIPTFIRGRADDERGWGTPVRNGKFVSFMSVQGCSRRRHPDRHDRRLRMQKVARALTMTAAAAGFTWIAVESARALSMF